LAELVDASDLKSELPKGRCRFESGSGHQLGTLEANAAAQSACSVRFIAQ
jgi:hypothetical protein